MQRRIHTVANSDRAAPHATTRSDGQSRHFDILRHAPGIVLSAIMARRVIERCTSVRYAPKLLTSRTPRSTSAIPATNRRRGMTSRGSVGTRATEKRQFCRVKLSRRRHYLLWWSSESHGGFNREQLFDHLNVIVFLRPVSRRNSRRAR